MMRNDARQIAQTEAVSRCEIPDSWVLTCWRRQQAEDAAQVETADRERTAHLTY